MSEPAEPASQRAGARRWIDGFTGFATGRAGWVLPGLVAVAWTVAAYLHLRPPAAVAAHHLRGYGSWSYAHLSYTDLLALYRIHELYHHAAPYVHTVIEYPVLTGVFMWAAAWAPGVQGYFLVSAVGLGACAVGCVYFLYRSSPQRAWIFALGPMLLVYSLLNWDLLAMLLMLAGWWAVRRARYATAGVLLSLGVFAKFFPLVLLVFCVLALWRDRADPARRAGAIRVVVAAAVTGLIVNVPFAIANVRGWANFFSFNASRGGGDGLLYQLHLVNNWPVARVDVLSAALVGGAMAYLAWRVWRGAPPEFAAAATFAVFMLVNKTFSPQYMLWVLVFALLADWPVWTYPMLTAAGLIDYVNAMITFYLVEHHTKVWGWYWANVFNLNLALRDYTVVIALVAGLWSGRAWLGLAAPSAAPPRDLAAGADDEPASTRVPAAAASGYPTR